MTDFIDLLEQQLVSAHRGRGRRFFAVPWRTAIVFAGAVAAAAAVVVAVLALSSPQSAPAPSPATQPPQTTPVNPPPASRIAVINGTPVEGLAGSTVDLLTSNGYRGVFAVSNDVTSPSITGSAVVYEPGHHNEAQSVAACLHIGRDHVAPMTATARSVAEHADVAVFLGADYVP